MASIEPVVFDEVDEIEEIFVEVDESTQIDLQNLLRRLGLSAIIINTCLGKYIIYRFGNMGPFCSRF